MELKRTIGAISVETQNICNILLELKKDEIISYKNLSEKVGRKMKGNDSHLQSSIKILLKDHQVVFENIRNIGYKRLNDNEIVSHTQTRTSKSIYLKCKRGIKKIMVAEDKHLDNSAFVKRNAALSCFGALAHASKPSKFKKLEQRVIANSNGQLPIGVTFDHMKDS